MSEFSSPPEGTRRRVEEVYTRRHCDECGEPAVKRATYLRNGARTNPGSRAFGRSDLTYCSDRDVNLCQTCRPPDLNGYTLNNQFLGSEYPHMLMYWKRTSLIETVEDK